MASGTKGAQAGDEEPARTEVAVQDDRVVVTFHFWGGGTIEYTVTKSGTTVTGTNA